MRRTALSAFFILIVLFVSQAQVLKPISWEVSLSEEGPAVSTEVEVQFRATIEDKWYLYSSDFDPDLGPMLTEFFFNENDTYERVGEITPVNPKRKFDSLWMGEYTYFKEEGLFTPIRIP